MAITPKTSWSFADGNTVGDTHTQGQLGISGNVRGNAGLYDVSTSPMVPVGSRMAFDDGRVYRYGHFFAACAPGKLCSIDATSQKTGPSDATTICNSSGGAVDYSNQVATIYVKGSQLVTTANSADTFAGGYFNIVMNSHDTTMQGQTYRIKSNAAVTAATSTMRLDFYDNLNNGATPTSATGLGSEAVVSIIGNKYKNLVIAAAADNTIAGVTMCDMAAGEYGWVQTWGEKGLFADEAIPMGAIIVLSDGTSGAVAEFGQNVVWSEARAASNFDLLATDPILGYALEAIVSAQYGLCYLQIAP